MDEPVPILALARLNDCLPSGIVSRAKSHGAAALVCLRDVLVAWDSADGETCADVPSSPTAGSRQRRSRLLEQDYSPAPEDAAEFERQAREDHERWDEEAEAAEAERAEFRRQIEAGIARRESKWVQCPDVSVQLDGEKPVRVIHVMRWAEVARGKPYGVVVHDDGSPGVLFEPADFCVPASAALELARRPDESVQSVVGRIREARQAFELEAEAERARRDAYWAFHQTWQKQAPIEFDSTGDDAARLATDADAVAASYWHAGQPIPDRVPRAWRPLELFTQERGIPVAEVLAAGIQELVYLHVLAGFWRIECGLWRELGANAAPDERADGRHHPLAPNPECDVVGPIALETTDLTSFSTDLDKVIDIEFLRGLPYSQVGDPTHLARMRLRLLKPSSISVHVRDLWIGPDAQAIVGKRFRDVAAPTAPTTEPMRTTPAVDTPDRGIAPGENAVRCIKPMRPDFLAYAIIRIGALAKLLVAERSQIHPVAGLDARAIADLVAGRAGEELLAHGFGVAELEALVQAGLSALTFPELKTAIAATLATSKFAGPVDRVVTDTVLGVLAERLSTVNPVIYQLAGRPFISRLASDLYDAMPKEWQATRPHASRNSLDAPVRVGLAAIGIVVSKSHVRADVNTK